MSNSNPDILDINPLKRYTKQYTCDNPQKLEEEGNDPYEEGQVENAPAGEPEKETLDDEVLCD